MVEKIIINPTKVRGYGNIINQHNTTDYTNYACTLTEETDTVNGAETTVNKITDTTLWFDKGITGANNDHYHYDSNGSVTPTTTGTKVLNTSGNTNFVYLSPVPLDQTISDSNRYKWNAPLVIEFDIIEATATTNSDAQLQVYSLTTGGNCTENIYSGDTGHWRIEMYENNTQKIYLNGILKKTTSLTLTNARISLRVRNGKYVTYKNFKIWEG